MRDYTMQHSPDWRMPPMSLEEVEEMMIGGDDDTEEEYGAPSYEEEDGDGADDTNGDTFNEENSNHTRSDTDDKDSL